MSCSSVSCRPETIRRRAEITPRTTHAAPNLQYRPPPTTGPSPKSRRPCLSSYQYRESDADACRPYSSAPRICTHFAMIELDMSLAVHLFPPYGVYSKQLAGLWTTFSYSPYHDPTAPEFCAHEYPADLCTLKYIDLANFVPKACVLLDMEQSASKWASDGTTTAATK